MNWFQYCCSSVILLLFVMNGAAPYVGLKFEYSNAMFSNLEVDGSNHFFLPSIELFEPSKYYFVHQLDIRSDTPPTHALLLLRLLEKLEHPIAGATEVEEERPVHQDLIRYHMAMFRQEQVGASFTLEDHDTGGLFVVSTDDAPEEWFRYTLLMTYPSVLLNYSTQQLVLREYQQQQ